MDLATRIVLFIFSLLILILSIGCLGVAIGWNPELTFVAATQWILHNPAEVGLLGLILLGLVVLSMALIFRKGETEPTIIKETNLGTIRISSQAVETLIKRAAVEIEGVRGIHPTLHSSDGKLNIQIALEVLPDTNIPELADKVQTRIEDYLEQTVGVTDVSVSLTVKEISLGQHKARVK